MTLGVRESRRLIGDYILTDDVPDSAFPTLWFTGLISFLLVHGMRDGLQQSREQGKTYDLQYRCPLPQKVENLLVVGCCVSGSHLAHSSYRVMNIAMAIGQAGECAPAATRVSPRELIYQMVQEWLTTTSGATIPCLNTVKSRLYRARMNPNNLSLIWWY